MNKELKILFVSHDASRTGAPIVLIHLLNWMKKQGAIISILLREGGVMEDVFKEISPTYIWNPFKIQKGIFNLFFNKLLYLATKRRRYQKFPSNLANKQFDIIYLNTVVSSSMAEKLKSLFNCPIILHVHENEFTINNFYKDCLSPKHILNIDHFIAVSESTKMNLINKFKIPDKEISIVYEFVPIDNLSNSLKDINISKEKLNIKDEFIVGGSGLTSWRKGVDLFIYIAAEVKRKKSGLKFKFIWVGQVSDSFKNQLNYELLRLGLDEKDILFTNRVDKPQEYFNLFDVFMLTSREDPFPLVCLEAAALSKPIICFTGAGGMDEFVNEINGVKIEYGAIGQAADTIINLATNPHLLTAKSKMVKKDIAQFDVSEQAPKILNIITKMINES